MTAPPDDVDLFDEAGYLRLYPGIAEAMMRGEIASAWRHFAEHGLDEGRRPNDVDPAFYLAAYIDIANDLGHAPEPDDAARHFVTWGRARGYLPNARASRPANGAALSSAHGGFWTDQANAADLIRARRDLGRIRARDIGFLTAMAHDGIADLNPIADPADRERLELLVDQAFTGQFPGMLFATAGPGETVELWRPELTAEPALALDPHMFSSALRTMLLAPAVTAALSLIFDAPPRLTASVAWLRQRATPDRDLAWHAHSLPLRCAALTLWLDPIGLGADDAAVWIWPGSHHLPDLPFPDGRLTLTDIGPAPPWARPSGREEAARQRRQRMEELLAGYDARRLAPVEGARTIRHVNLVHAITPPAAPRPARAVTAWYCPSYVTPVYVETRPAIAHQQDGFRFSSGVYPDMPPIME